MRKEWLEASTVLLLALQKKPFSTPYNYKMLFLKRSSQSSFMPKGYVFPGGAVDNVDCNGEWFDAFKACGVSKLLLERLLIDVKDLPPMFQDSQSQDKLSKQLALKITAVREAFEESGVLLCRKENLEKENGWGSTLSFPMLNDWRCKVQKDASTFLEMCRTLRIVPDVWGLKLWSNWLTPPKMKKRFDTSFFTVCIPYQPETCADGSEIEELVWHSPLEILAANRNSDVWLPPPQYYELSRLLPFCMLEDLAAFTNEREHFGIERFGGPPNLHVKDGTLFLLPGDDLLAEQNPEKYKDMTMEQLRHCSQSIHRLEMVTSSDRCKVVAVNVRANFGHVLPFTQDSPS